MFVAECVEENVVSDNLSPDRLLALLCIAGATMLFASGGSADPTERPFDGTGFTQDPCSLLSNAEVSQQVGRQVLAVRNRDQQPMCEWTLNGEPSLDTVVFLEYQKQNSRFHLDVIRDLKRPSSGPGVRRFAIGDGALLRTSRRDISVLVGNSTFRIVAGGSIPLSGDALVALARLAQARAH
jgi:hypothetical protein